MSQTYDLYNDAPVIRTFTGKWFNCFEPDIDSIDIIDIAHALSMQPRFGGHLPVFYSVAEHSIRCCHLAEPADKLAALLHDASEAYLLDVPRPIKRKLTEYAGIEAGIMKLIAQKFGFQFPLTSQVKEIDETMLQVEWNNVMLGQGFICMPQNIAKQNFISLFNRLK